MRRSPSGGPKRLPSASVTKKKQELFTYSCGFRSSMSGQLCTQAVQVITDKADIWHTCVDGKRKRLNLEDA